MKARKIIIPAAIVVGVAAIGIAVAALGNSASRTAFASTTEIQRKTLENTISVSGTVQSTNTQKVYSKLSYTVDEVNVEVGDTVKKGDVLCTINTDDLQQQILQQQATVDTSGVNSDYQLSEAERQYNEALEKYEKGENSSIVSAQRSIEQAEKNLEDAKRQASFGNDTTLPANVQSAQNSVDSAKAALESAQASYNTAVTSYEKAERELEPEHYPANAKSVYDSLEEKKAMLEKVQFSLYNAELQEALGKYNSAKSAYEAAKSDTSETYSQSELEALSEAYTAAKQEYETVKAKYDEDNLKDQIDSLQTQMDSYIENLETVRDNAKIAMDNAKTSVENAERSYKSAQESYDTIVSQGDNTGESYGISVKNAEDALENAKNDYDRIVKQVESELASLKKQAEQQRTVSGLNDPQVISLRNMEDKLQYAVITAPCDGVVTAVNAEEGVSATAAGALFVIQDLDSLKVASSVGEYDISSVAVGMTATIRCDALDGTEYEGKVTNVAPVAETASGSAVSYKIEVEVDGEDGRLMVGMNTKVNILSDRKEGALTVTYDALTVDDDGNDALYIAEKDGDGVYHARLVTVTIGLETDYEIEVISDQLSEGALVLTDTTLISDGDVVMIDESGKADTAETSETSEQVTE